VSRSKGKVHPDPIAVTSSGDLLVNAGRFDDVDTLEEALRVAKKERGAIFIGFVVQEDEVPLLSDRVQDACKEGAAFVVGKRRRKRRKRG
jgi:hydrogenase maturation factor